MVLSLRGANGGGGWLSAAMRCATNLLSMDATHVNEADLWEWICKVRVRRRRFCTGNPILAISSGLFSLGCRYARFAASSNFLARGASWLSK